MGKVHTSNNANSWGFSYDFSVAKPMDTRTVVATYSDLTKEDTWKQGGAYMNYKGMTVACADTGKLYVYIGGTASAIDVAKASNWVAQGSDLEVEVAASLVLSNNKDVYVCKVPANTESLSFIKGSMTDGKLREVIFIIDNSENTKTCMIALPNEGIEVIYNIEDMYVNPGLSSEFSFLIDTTGSTPIIRVAGLIKE